MDWLKFFNRFLPHVAPAIAKKFGGLVQQYIGDPAAAKLGPVLARGMVKAGDAVAAACAKLLPNPSDRQQACAAWAAGVEEEMTECMAVLRAYMPLSLAVEEAKLAGDETALAAARAARKKLKESISEEAQEFFGSLFGAEDED